MSTTTHPLRSRKPFVCLGLLIVAVLLQLTACGQSADDVSLRILAPSAKEFLRGWTTIEVSAQPRKAITEVLIGVQSLEDPNALLKVLARKTTDGPHLIDWDTTSSKDGAYKIVVQARTLDRSVAIQELQPVWVLNQTARLRIPECKNQPKVVRDKLDLSVEWVDFASILPPTPIDLFVQGKLHKRAEKAPYTFSVDLTSYPHSTEVYLSAVATEGLFRGTTTICSLFIDRLGPRIRFVYPSQKGEVIPQTLFVTLEIEDDFGIAQVEVTANGTAVGSLTQPPFLVPIDLTSFAHNQTITLSAVATDTAGNKTKDPPTLQVKLDGLPPQVEVLQPLANSSHTGAVVFQARIVDEAQVDRVDFYIEDETGKRIDNLLHTTGTKNGRALFEAQVESVISLYGAGPRNFVVEAFDSHQNKTTKRVPLIFGCRDDSECPRSGQWRCLGNRCIIPHKLGDVCDHPASCEPPLICFYGGLSWCDKVKLGICRKPCSVDQQNCSPGYFCRQIDGKSKDQGACFPGDPCSPFTVNCSDNQQCVPWGRTSFVCVPTGNGRTGSSCVPYSCSGSNGCIKKYVCVPLKSGGGRCHPICDQTYATRDCSSSSSCRTFPLRDKSSNSIGYCSSSR